MLTTKNLKNCLNIIQAALHCESQENIAELWDLIQQSSPAKSLQIILCDNYASSNNRSLKTIQFGDLALWEEQFNWNKSCNNNPIIQKCFNTNRIINTDELQPEFRVSDNKHNSSHYEGLLIGKKRNLPSQYSSVTSISFIPEELTTQDQLLLETALPHINEIPNRIEWHHMHELTDKELEILHWAAKSKSHKDIGLITGISERTVRFHLSNIYKKLNVEDRIGAVQIAVRYGIL